MAYHRMSRVRSMRARLSLVFLFLFLLVIVLGFQSVSSLSDVNEASAQIRLRWLPSTRALDDLNNFTTDFPAAAAARGRAGDAAEDARIERQMGKLDRAIAAAQTAYEAIPHAAAEVGLYKRFVRSWKGYRARVDARAEAAGDAAYEVSSRLLEELTAKNAASVREAAHRSDLAYAQARRRVVLAIVLAGLLVAGAMLYVTRSISAPLVDLAARMHRLATNETSVEVHGTERQDEIGEMARAVVVFRVNAIDLAQNRHALSRQASVLRDKLAEEKRVTLLQRNFVSMASHEFRTPLAIIDGHAQRLIAMRERLTSAELTERARKVRNAVHRMTQLIDNLIGSARLIDGGIQLAERRSPAELTALLHDVCQTQRELTPDRTIQDGGAQGPVMVTGDAALLRQMLANLLSNAIKYSPSGTDVSVTLAGCDTAVEVTIEDRGIGIPAAEHGQIFDRYYRGSNTTGIVGSGVGLNLVKVIAELHGGSVAVTSSEGVGSRFTVRLPTTVQRPALESFS